MNKQTEALKMVVEAMSCISQSRGDPLLKAIRACKEALELSEKQHTISDKEQLAQGLDPYVLAGVALEVASFLADDNMDITRAEWRNIVITQALRCIRECNITQETDDIDEVYVSWLAQEESYS